MEASTITSPVRALELLVGRARIVVPVRLIARVIALAYEPLPLAHRLVVGLGFEHTRTVVCVSLTPSRAVGPGPGATTKAVLFESKTPLGYGLCIDEALDLVDIVQVERGTVQPNLPRWVRRARTSEGRTLGWIDAEILVDELSAPAVRA
jgi:hypothetical protein